MFVPHYDENLKMAMFKSHDDFIFNLWIHPSDLTFLNEDNPTLLVLGGCSSSFKEVMAKAPVATNGRFEYNATNSCSWVIVVVVAIGGVDGIGFLVLTPIFGPNLGMPAVALEGEVESTGGKGVLLSIFVVDTSDSVEAGGATTVWTVVASPHSCSTLYTIQLHMILSKQLWWRSSDGCQLRKG